MDLSFLKDPAVWTAIVAVLALILSQLPPVRELIKGVKVKITVPELVMLYHFMGNIQTNLFLDIHNVGGRTICIAKIECGIKNSSGSWWKLPAQTYYSREPPSQHGQPPPELLMGLISLKSGERWSETVRCFRLWTETEEEKVNDIIAKIRSNIIEKIQQQIIPSQQLAEANEDFVKEAKDFFEKKFDLHKGNYQFFIATLSESNQVLNVRGFDFTLFESNIRALQAHTEEYKYGAGIYYPIMDPTKVVWIRLRPIADEQARQIYEKFRSS